MRKFLNLRLIYVLSLAVLAGYGSYFPALAEALDSDTGTCLIVNNDGSNPAYKSDNEVGDRTVIYFDLNDCLGYPSELVSVNFSLVDIPASEWPATVDLIVYDRAAESHQCYGPGLEMCRQIVICDAATFAYPNFGTVVLTNPCCLKGPFFVGVEYIAPVKSVYPPLALDEQNNGERCKAWQYSAIDDDWVEWMYYYGVETAPGFPKITAEVRPFSTLCTAECGINGDFDNSGVLSISDCVYFISWFQSPNNNPPSWLDATGDCIVNQEDYGMAWQFCFGSPWEPPPPAVERCFCTNPWSEQCAVTPGDADGSKAINVSDAVYIISFIFAGGPAPTPYAVASGDGNGDCTVSISDAVALIAFIFSGGAAPVTCTLWPAACGTLR